MPSRTATRACGGSRRSRKHQSVTNKTKHGAKKRLLTLTWQETAKPYRLKVSQNSGSGETLRTSGSGSSFSSTTKWSLIKLTRWLAPDLNLTLTRCWPLTPDEPAVCLALCPSLIWNQVTKTVKPHHTFLIVLCISMTFVYIVFVYINK